LKGKNKMPPLSFAPTKLHSLMVFILDYLDRELGKIEFAKLIYLVDLEAYRLLGETITGDNYNFQEKGPLIDSFYIALQDMSGHEIISERKASLGFSAFGKHSQRKGKEQRFLIDLNDIERAVIIRAIEKLKNFTPRQLEDLAYQTEPVKKVLEIEEKLGQKPIGSRVDLSTAKQNESIKRWRKNMQESSELEADAEAFLEKKALEIDEFLASLG